MDDQKKLEQLADDGRKRYFAAEQAYGMFYARSYDSCDSDTYTCLFDYIASWIEDSNGTRDCSDDFQTYLQAVILIVESWHADRLNDFDGLPDDKLHIPRRITQIMDWSRPSCRILDPSYFLFYRSTFRENEEGNIWRAIFERLPPKQD